jgi:dinuclear metal center YbgI/SA1388 family protein
MSQSVDLHDVVNWLDAYLRIREVPDSSGAINGLQVENEGRIDRIIAAVDASQAMIDGVVTTLARESGDVGFSGDHDHGSPLVLVHHGLFWDGNLPVTGRRYRRLRTLLANDIALYSAHIPLDLHPEVGNNVLLARMLGVEVEGWFGMHRGVAIGVWGTAPAALGSRDAVGAKLAEALGLPAPPRLIPGGREQVRRIGIITGGAGGSIAEARDAGVDTFITGEGAHHTYFDATELGVNVFHAGHYATETVGVRALAERVGREFGLPTAFHDHPTGM